MLQGTKETKGTQAALTLAAVVLIASVALGMTSAREGAPGSGTPALATPADFAAVVEVADPALCQPPPLPEEAVLASLRAAYAVPGTPVASTPASTPAFEAVVTEEDNVGQSSSITDVWIAGVPWIVNGRVVPSPPAPYAGAPLDAATLEAVRSTLRATQACFNGGRLFANYAYYTEAGRLREFVEARAAGWDAADLEAELRAPLPASFGPDYWALVPLPIDGRVLPDGRVAVLVRPGARPVDVAIRPQIYVLAYEEGRWLVDQRVTDGLEPVDPPGVEATPMS